MPHKAPVPPLCRWCGKPIPKVTETVYFAMGYDPPIRNVNAKPKSRGEAQRLVNQQIVSLRWSYLWDEESYPRRKRGRDHIDMVTMWDGESYADPFFCKGDHARRFGYAAARKGLAMPDYNEAVKRRSGA